MVDEDLPPDLAHRFAELARTLVAEKSVAGTLDRIVHLAVDTVEGCHHAGVSLVRARQRVETAAATDDLVRRCDGLQYELSEGPCLDAIWEDKTLQVDDMSAETRWPRYAPAVVELGVRSMLAFRLFTDVEDLGALNLYSKEPGVFGETARDAGLIFAAHAAVALAHAETEANLRNAVETRTVIGQAQGILMEREHLSAEQAFEVLRRASQTMNVKLRELAERVVLTGEEPLTERDVRRAAESEG